MSTKEAMGGGCCASSTSAHATKHQGFEELSAKDGKQGGNAESGSSRSWTMYIVIGLAVVLLVFSAVQTFQINKTEDSLVTGFSVGGRPAGGGSPVNIPQVAPTALPRMVGGC